MNARPRAELLRLILQAEFPLEPLRAELATYPWDVDEPLVTLRPHHVTRVLDRFIRGELAAADVQHWAEALEVREDVGTDISHEAGLRRILFILANPDVNGRLTPERATELIGRTDAME